MNQRDYMGVYIENDLNTFGVATAGTKKKMARKQEIYESWIRIPSKIVSIVNTFT